MRRRLTASLAAAGLSAGLTAAASAADLGRAAPAPMYTKALPPTPIWDWSGFYLGGSAGWARENATGTSDFTDTGVPDPVSGIAFPSNPQSNSLSGAAFVGGLQVGYNWQLAPRFVLGAEGDWNWLRTKYSFCRQTDVSSTACIDSGDGFESIGSEAHWLATARARGGVTWDRYMFYGTAGAAWGSIEPTESLSCLQNGCGRTSSVHLATASSVTQTKAGWVAGLGAEVMLSPAWSVRAEWLHYDLGNLTDTFTTVGDNKGTQSVVWSRDERFDAFRVGVNYRFGGWRP
jgi:outer membrane immunogenic protein